MQYTTFVYEMIRITERCVTFKKYARNFNFLNQMKPTVTLSHSHAALCLPHLHETHQAYIHTRVGNLIVATIYLQLIQDRYMFRSFTVLQCSHQHCVQPVASDVEVVGYLQQRLLC